ncbi:alpha-amylase/4-alpha-glucanotransferase domain-containing protein [Thermodesulfobacteriota bacterium]
MSKVKFIFCVHNHQPVGNFDHVLEHSFQQSYSPFLEVMKKHPSIKFVIHFSGILLNWLDQHKKDYMDDIRELVRSGRVEIISSGIYEPVLASLPEIDRIGQVAKYNSTIKELTGYAPKGAWLTERIYEPQLPKSLNKAGIDYVIVDDYHFKKSGLKDDDLFGYYMTEEEGYGIKVFGGSERLRYLMPFQDPQETLAHFKDMIDKGKGNLALFADDGEKFGSWPNTYDWVYNQHWLDNFLGMLEKNSDIVETVTFSEYIKEHRSLGMVYLPTCSYMEMGGWSLPAEATLQYENSVSFANDTGNQELKRFLSGGTWRNFISMYPESNNMHKKMLYLSERIHDHYEFSKDDMDLPDYLVELYKAQCNDAYWHGVFGGLYLPHLRDAIYRHLIMAEEALDNDMKRGSSYLDVITRDINLDGEDELLIESDNFNMYIEPGYGGSIYEYDYKPAHFNIMNTLTRRWEAYHDKIVKAEDAASSCETKTIHDMVVSKEEGLDKYLHFDLNKKVSLVDHFFDNISLDTFRESSYKECGDFSTAPYDFSIKEGTNSTKITLERTSFVMMGESRREVSLQKVITVKSGNPGFSIDYKIKNLSDEELKTTFGVEFNLMMLSPDDKNRYFEVAGHTLSEPNLAGNGEHYDVEKIRIVDRYFNFDVCFDFPRMCNFLRAPVETVSVSEGGFERIFQSSSMLFFKMLTLVKDEEFLFSINFNTNKI